MWRKVLGLLWVGVFAACTQPLNPCVENTDCPEGSTCRENVCVGTGVIGSEACDGGCEEYQVCLASTLQCSPKYSALTVTPGNGAVVDGGPLTVSAKLILAVASDAGFPEQLSLTANPPDGAPKVLTKAAEEGVYSARWTPAKEGDHQLTLKVDYPKAGGPSAEVTLSVDKTSPSLTVSLPSRSDGGTTDSGFIYADPEAPNAWRRDQTVALRIESSAPDVNPQSVSLNVSGFDGGTLPVTQVACAGGTGYCGTVNLDLWRPSLNAFRGEFAIEVKATDNVSNAGTGSGRIPVTRWKWRYDIASAAVTAAPAVGNKGTLYVGTTNVSNNDGRLLALSDDGRLLWNSDTGAVVASPTVGNTLSTGSERVYAAHKKSNLNRVGFYSGSNAFVTPCNDFSSTNALVQSSLAVSQISTGGGAALETVYGIYTGRGSGTIFAVRPDAEDDPQFRCPTSASVGDINAPGAMLALGSSVVFGTSNGRLKSYTLSSTGAWNTSAQWDRTLGLANPTSMAVVDGGIIGGSNDGSGSKLFFAALDGGSTPTTIPASSPAWNVSVGNSLSVRGAVGLNSNSLLVIDTADGGTATIDTPSDVVKGAPVWGAGGHVYTASSTTGVIQARRPLETVEWQFDTQSPIEASMNLDCSRSADGGVLSGRPGVLYAASQDGKVFAILVDSTGLDPSAPWPKYQHDSRNTGNPDTPITSCP